MFRPKSAGSFASKIAHTSTLPALGNKDLKLLQDLITNEKTVLLSLQKLAVDLTRASESLKSWGLGEGDDLGDVLSHATHIYSHITTALNNFANHEHTVRAHLKAIRSREERLDETKRRRKNVAAKADAADKKLSKMSGENKNLPTQTELLNKLRDEMRQLDSDIMVEESRLGDFKRLSTRNFMALKLGGLLEFGEKATIVGELGKLLIDEIPLDPTPPGQPRTFYHSHDKTENLDTEVSRCIGEVVFTPPPDIPESVIPASTSRASEDVAVTGLESSSVSAFTAPTMNDRGGTPTPDALRLGEFGEPPGQNNDHHRFGSGPVRLGEDGPPRGGGGGQFSTFPVKSRTDQSFSASVADALGDREKSTGDAAPVPAVNVGGNAWDGDEYVVVGEGKDMDPPQYAHALSVEKGVRFRTPSMEVSGMGTIAPGVASPVNPSGGWHGRPAGAAAPSYDAPLSPVYPVPEEEYYDEKKQPLEYTTMPYSADTAYDAREHEHEHARNAAAARAVALEIDALDFPTPPPQQYPSPPSPTSPTQIPIVLRPTRPLSINRTPSPYAHQRDASPISTRDGGGDPSPRSPSPEAPPSIPRNAPSSLSPSSDNYVTSPLTSAGGGGGGPRTISAAAFKRSGRAGNEAEVPGKKRLLPASPRPPGSALRNAPGGSMDNLGFGGGSNVRLPEDSLDPEPDSPVVSDYGSLGNVRVVNSEAGMAGIGTQMAKEGW